MTEILEYIVENYTWFLGSAIIILLAIIGCYADKTNFGQGKIEDNSFKNNREIPKRRINDYLQGVEVKDNSFGYDEPSSTAPEKVEHNQIENMSAPKDKEISLESFEDNISGVSKSSDKSEKKEENQNEAIGALNESNNVETESKKTDEFENKLDEFDEQLNELLPDKGIITDDLLSDIDDLSVNSSLDSEPKKSIPDLDDIELPKIKQMKEDPVDIWKF